MAECSNCKFLVERIKTLEAEDNVTSMRQQENGKGIPRTTHLRRQLQAHTRKGLGQSRLDFGAYRPREDRGIRLALPQLRVQKLAPARREKSKTDARRKDEDSSVFNRLSHRKRSTFERLSNTYSPSTTKSGPNNTTPRDRSRGKNPLDSRDCSSDKSHSRIRSHLRGVEESYSETYSSQRTRHRDRSRNVGHHGGMKKKRVNESPSSRASVSSSSHGTHQRPRRSRESMDEEDLAVPWTCEDVDPFTPRIRNFRSSRKTRMPNNVKTYDGTGDPEDHLKVFQAAVLVEHWAMPTWCHMFNSTLIGVARVWFDELPAKSIDGYKDLKAAFLSYFMQQKKYVKDLVEIHNIKQKDWETIEEFMERETAAASKKKVHAPWKPQDQSKHHASDRKLEFQKLDFQNQPREGRGSNKFTPLTWTPKEIFTAEAVKFKPPTPMVTPLEKQSDSSKFCEFHNDKGHSTDECVQLKKQIEELVREGKLSQFVKGIRQEKDQHKPGKNDFPTKDKAAAIYMIQSWQRVTRQKVTQSFDRIREIVFPPLTANEGTEGPLVIEAEIGGHTVHRMYVDGGSSMEVLFEHCFNRL
ncbi:reverse transcriptase domain-containing protein [Tanacetum coccineum]